MKRYIKLNDNDNHLSLGNLIRIIKEYAINKTSAYQSEIFSTIFNNYSINDTTINNYCTGVRGINNEYKQIYIIYKKKYLRDKNVLIDVVFNLLSLITGTIYTENDNNKKLHLINNNNLLKEILIKLYNISKNDTYVNIDLSNKLVKLIDENNLYEAIISILFFVILDKKQPLYEKDIKKEVIENILINTDISSNELEEYLNLKFSEGINYNHSLYAMAESNNTYALYEIATNEYKGYVKGFPRYDISYKYFEKSALKNYPSSYYMMAKMLIDEKIGNKSKDNLKKAHDYLLKASSLGNIASINLLGNMYKNGIYPVKKDIDKAIEYYKEAANHNYTYAFNNLGKICEDNKDFKNAFLYYEKSANLKESYALNKLGEFYRKGLYIKKDMNKAFYYYNEAISGPINNIYAYAYYNLAKHFYLTGEIILIKDIDKAIHYLSLASDMNNIDSSILLLYLYAEKYLKDRNSSTLNKINELVVIISNNKLYSERIKKTVEHNLLKIKENKNININDVLNI